MQQHLRQSPQQRNRSSFLKSLQGHDTSAQTLTWTLFALGIHPEIQRKVHKELDRVFGNDKIGDVTKADVGDLVYLDSVLKVVQIE